MGRPIRSPKVRKRVDSLSKKKEKRKKKKEERRKKKEERRKKKEQMLNEIMFQKKKNPIKRTPRFAPGDAQLAPSGHKMHLESTPRKFPASS